MAKKQKKSKHAAGKTKAPKAGSATTIATLEKRIAMLGAALSVPNHVRRHALALGTSDAFKDPAVALVQVRQISFEKSDDSPDLVRITLDGFEEVVSPGDHNGTSRPRPVGTFVTVLVEAIGNPGQTASIAVKNASPALIQITIPQGQNQTFGTKPLLVG